MEVSENAKDEIVLHSVTNIPKVRHFEVKFVPTARLCHPFCQKKSKL